MQKIIEVFILFSLEKLTMCEMPKLERCSSNSLRSFNSTLRVLEIRKCPQLKSFPLFEYYRQIKEVSKVHGCHVLLLYSFMVVPI